MVHTAFIFKWPVKIEAEILLQASTTTCTRVRCLNPSTLGILTIVSKSNLLPESMNNNWGMDGDVVLDIPHYKYCSIFQTDSTEYHSLFCTTLLLWLVTYFMFFGRNKRLKDLKYLLVAEIINISLSTASSKRVNDFAIDMPPSIICSCRNMK